MYSVWKVSELPFQGEILYWYNGTFLFVVLSPVIIVYRDEGELFIIKVTTLLLAYKNCSNIITQIGIGLMENSINCHVLMRCDN
jgi:hypothetical protein